MSVAFPLPNFWRFSWYRICRFERQHGVVFFKFDEERSKGEVERAFRIEHGVCLVVYNPCSDNASTGEWRLRLRVQLNDISTNASTQVEHVHTPVLRQCHQKSKANVHAEETRCSIFIPNVRTNTLLNRSRSWNEPFVVFGEVRCNAGNELSERGRQRRRERNLVPFPSTEHAIIY